MDAQATMRLMFDTMDAYDRGDFDRLGEIYAKDARWINTVDPNGPHCRNRNDIFAMFRQRLTSAIPRSNLYEKSPPSIDVPRRRYVTRWCAGIAAAFAVIVWSIDPASSTTIIVIDCLLIALILAFRFAKEIRFVTPNDAYTISRSTLVEKPGANV